MSRLPRLSGKKMVQILQREGYRLSHVRGSHHYLRKPETPFLVVVPVHGSRELPLGTLHSVLKQAGLTAEEFTDLLKKA